MWRERRHSHQQGLNKATWERVVARILRVRDSVAILSARMINKDFGEM
jgi:hypothetical protein